MAHTFRIASNTETFVAVATMKLVEAGTLQLDNPIAGVVPDDVRSVLAGRYDLTAITVRMLLQHTSGIASHEDAGAVEVRVCRVKSRSADSPLDDGVERGVPMVTGCS